MNIQEFLRTATKTLRTNGIESARLDILILLEDALDINRSRVLAHPEMVLTDAQYAQLNKLVVQRKEHVPLAYIRGHAAFYGRDFIVNTATLVPRPETEAMITLLKDILPDTADTTLAIADIGTGSGCLGITAALEIPGSAVYVYDLSEAALKIVATNTARHKVRVHAAVQDLLAGDTNHYNVILANLPYVPTDYPINQAATHEPAEALFSGNDGLEHYRTFWQQVAARKTFPAHIIIESFPAQHTELEKLAKAAGYTLHATLGYAQHFTTATI